ncbi:RES family NAD+ phosphorylase [Thauera terpenica]|nr:RES domain-containing protein [Thauera terpenica]
MVQDDRLRANYVLIPAHVDLPETRVNVESLPTDWRALGARGALHEIGRAWLDSARSAVLSVPSAVLPTERNYLLNPKHPDFARIRLGDPVSLAVDMQLFRNLG